MDKERYLNDLQAGLNVRKKSATYILACCNYASKLIDSNLPVIFDVKHLSLLLGISPFSFGKLLYSLDEYCYHEITIPKKSGGNRRLDIPSIDLKYIQRWILDNILSQMHISGYANGFIKDKSILTNAISHTRKECLISLDIQDFFPSVKFEQVFYIFKYYGYTKEVSYTLAKLCTHNSYLPQGSPASPAITNILCLKLDKRLSMLADKYQASYSRYADDMYFSGNKGISAIIPIVKKIVSEEGFSINEKKTHIAFSHQRQEVTGLIVNGDTVKVSQMYKRRLRQEIYYCQKFGIQNHQEKLQEEYSFYKEHLYGKAYFVNMIEPKIGEKFLEALDSINWEY